MFITVIIVYEIPFFTADDDAEDMRMVRSLERPDQPHEEGERKTASLGQDKHMRKSSRRDEKEKIKPASPQEEKPMRKLNRRDEKEKNPSKFFFPQLLWSLSI